MDFRRVIINPTTYTVNLKITIVVTYDVQELLLDYVLDIKI